MMDPNVWMSLAAASLAIAVILRIRHIAVMANRRRTEATPRLAKAQELLNDLESFSAVPDPDIIAAIAGGIGCLTPDELRSLTWKQRRRLVRWMRSDYQLALSVLSVIDQFGNRGTCQMLRRLARKRSWDDPFDRSDERSEAIRRAARSALAKLTERLAHEEAEASQMLLRPAMPPTNELLRPAGPPHGDTETLLRPSDGGDQQKPD
jgi:hypothetical protein